MFFVFFFPHVFYRCPCDDDPIDLQIFGVGLKPSTRQPMDPMDPPRPHTALVFEWTPLAQNNMEKFRPPKLGT